MALARLVPERLLSEWRRELGRLCGEGVPGALGLVLERQGVEGATAAPSRGLAGGGDPRKVCLCDLRTTGLWRHEEIQASAELA